MITEYIYANQSFATLAELEAGVSAMKRELDERPTSWCVVKVAEPDANGGWLILPQELTDAEILALDASRNYSVSSIYDGVSDVGLTAQEAEAKVSEHRTSYANLRRVNQIITMQYWEPQNEVMAGYITQPAPVVQDLGGPE